MTKVQLPDGCYGLEMASGKKYRAGKPGGAVEVSSSDAHYINTSWYGQSGVMNGSAQFALGTKRGRFCTACKRVWQAWSEHCPRCGQDTTLMEAYDDDRLRNDRPGTIP